MFDGQKFQFPGIPPHRRRLSVPKTAIFAIGPRVGSLPIRVVVPPLAHHSTCNVQHTVEYDLEAAYRWQTSCDNRKIPTPQCALLPADAPGRGVSTAVGAGGSVRPYPWGPGNVVVYILIPVQATRQSRPARDASGAVISVSGAC